MAIQFAPVRYVRRSQGHSIVAAAAYNARAEILDERSGKIVGDARDKYDLEAHVIKLPDGGDPRYQDLYTTWNSAEACEKRWDASLGRNFIWPLDPNLSLEQRRECGDSFAYKHFVSKGLVVQLDYHRPHEGSRNWHIHALVSSRKLEGSKFAAKKARDLGPVIRRGAFGKPFVAEGEIWCRLWAEHQREYFREHKLNLIVDPIAIIPGKETFGPKRSWKGPKADIPERIAELKRQNTEAARDPKIVFEHLQEQQQLGNVKRFLEKSLPFVEREPIRLQVEALKRAVLEQARYADWVPDRSRRYSPYDIIREKSDNPDIQKMRDLYLKRLADTPKLEKKMNALRGLIRDDQAKAREHSYEQGLRYEKMSRWRKLADKIGLTDSVLGSQQIQKDALGGDQVRRRQSLAELKQRLEKFKREEVHALDIILPHAERVLDQRRKIAQNAERDIAQMDRRERERQPLTPEQGREREQREPERAR